MDLSPANIARLEHVLRTLDFTQGADAEIRADGYLWINWLQVLDTAEGSQIYQGVRQQLHAVVSLLDPFKAE